MDVDEMLSKVENILNSAAKLALKEKKVCTVRNKKQRKRNGLTETVIH